MKKLFILYFITLIVGALAEEKKTIKTPREEMEINVDKEEVQDPEKVLSARRRGASSSLTNQQQVKA